MHQTSEERFHFHKKLMTAPLHDFLSYTLSLPLSPRALYEELIIPEMHSIDSLSGEPLAIWTEHRISNRIRCLMENLALPLYREAYARHDFENAPLVVVLCPEGEYHELAARMMADIFVLAGFRTDFVGANTPKHQVIASLSQLEFHYLALSVTDYYNLIATKHMIEKLREVKPDVSLIAGGQAFHKNPHFIEEMQIDHYIADIDGVFRFAKEVGR